MTSILGRSPAHSRLLELVSVAASTDAEVLIQGPSGVGKELYARCIHEQSPRARHPFVPLNCGAVPLELFENELFGHAGGAFTGAIARTSGLVAEAEGGTLFLDEIDALHPSNQVKLLRLLQQKEYRPLGDSRLRRTNARIIAATNANLLAEAKEGRFRLDLFFRLRVLPLDVPPLKDRSEDIPLLLDHFIRQYSTEYSQPPVVFSVRAMERLASYAWPGNVRELENCARFLLCNHGGREVDVGDLPLLEELSRPDAPEPPQPTPEPFKVAKHRMVSAFERTYLAQSLAAHRGNIAAAARASGKNRRAFFELMRRHGLTQKQR